MTEAKLIEIYNLLIGIDDRYKLCIKPSAELTNPSTSFFHLIDGVIINRQRLNLVLAQNNIIPVFNPMHNGLELYVTIEI